MGTVWEGEGEGSGGGGGGVYPQRRVIGAVACSLGFVED